MILMITVAEAIGIIKEQTRALESEEIDMTTALGRVLAEDVVADTDLPPFDRAQMDGYALRSADTENVPARLSVVGEAAAGRGWHEALHAGEAVRIMTGAPVPAGADSVQQVEVTRELDEGRTVEISRATEPGQFIVRRASEIRRGETVLRRGEEINAARMAVLASFGYARVRVGARPRVAVLATGTELVPVTDAPGQDQIRDSNTFSLGAYAEIAGARVERLKLAGDDLELLKREIEEAAARVDALILSGGVSMGVYDFTKAALRSLGAEIFFERVSLRPGKPTVFAKLGKALVFGLPGNPVSVSVTFNLFARTALKVMQGALYTELKEERALLSRSVRGAAGRESFLPAELRTNERGQLMAEPLKWGGSSDFVAFARATALINVPQGTASLDAGEAVRVLHLPA